MSTNNVQTMLSQYSFTRTNKEKLKHKSDDEEENQNCRLPKSMNEKSPKDEQSEDLEKTFSKDEEKADDSTSDDSVDDKLYLEEENIVSNSDSVSGKIIIIIIYI